MESRLLENPLEEEIQLFPFQKFQLEFTQHIRNPEKNVLPLDVPKERMRVYNELLFNNIESVLAGCFPVIKKVLDETAWLSLVRDFFSEHSCRRPIYRQVPEEFIEYLHSERENSKDPSFLFSLAHYEWVELELSISEEKNERTELIGSSNWMDETILFSAPKVVLSYPFPVHQISPDFQPNSPSPEPHFYLVFRDTNGAVQFVVLNQFSAWLLQEIFSSKQTVQKILEEAGLKDPLLKKEVTAFFETLQVSGAVLGTVLDRD